MLRRSEGIFGPFIDLNLNGDSVVATVPALSAKAAPTGAHRQHSQQAAARFYQARLKEQGTQKPGDSKESTVKNGIRL